MADNQLREMISAFASGCMDRENFIQFKEYLNSGGSLPKKELGELQNTMALVPIILELEKPDPELKRRVAKKLLSLQDEIKEKIKQKKARLAEEKAKGNLSASEADIDFPDFEATFTTREIETLKTLDQKSSADKIKTEEQRRTVSEADKRDYKKTKTAVKRTAEKVSEPKSSKMALFGWITAAVLFILIIITYFSLSSGTKELEEKLKSQEKQLGLLKKELALNKQIVSEYKELIQFLKNKNNYIVELTGGRQYPSAMGRLIISYNSGEGVLILENPPALEENFSYQLWLVTKGKSISLGTLSKEKDKLYYYIYNIPKLSLNEIDLFRITNEPKEGSIIPLGNTLLYGSVPKF